MFRIIKDGVSVGMTETPNYIRQAENGCYVLCPEPEASGIAISGVPYRLLGREAPEGMGELDAVMLEETDAGGEEEPLDEACACGHQYAGAGRG